jgi:DNA-binding CsgD family transcriptional regulator
MGVSMGATAASARRILFAVDAGGERVLGAPEEVAAFAARLRMWSADGRLARGLASEPLWRALGDAASACVRSRLAEIRQVGLSHASDEDADINVLAIPAEGPAAAAPALAILIHARGNVAELLKRRFDLSRSEAQVALAVARGHALAEIARLRGVGLATVRTQLKSALAKTGLRRQAQLAAFIAPLMASADV